MLANAAARVFEAAAAACAIIVNAKNANAVAFYEHHDFRRFGSAERSLFLPLETARKALGP